MALVSNKLYERKVQGRLSEAPPPGEVHHIIGIIYFPNLPQPLQVVAIHILQWGSDDRQVRVQGRVCERLSFCLGIVANLADSLTQRTVYGLVRLLLEPRKGDVERIVHDGTICRPC